MKAIKETAQSGLKTIRGGQDPAAVLELKRRFRCALSIAWGAASDLMMKVAPARRSSVAGCEGTFTRGRFACAIYDVRLRSQYRERKKR